MSVQHHAARLPQGSLTCSSVCHLIQTCCDGQGVKMAPIRTLARIRREGQQRKVVIAFGEFPVRDLLELWGMSEPKFARRGRLFNEGRSFV